MAELPLCDRCPKCGCPEFDAARPEGWVSFQHDRICRACQTRYAVPTPPWAAKVLIGICILLVWLFGIGAIIEAKAGALLGLAVNGLFVALGIQCLNYAARAARQQVAVAPPWQDSQSPLGQNVPPPVTAADTYKNLGRALLPWVLFISVTIGGCGGIIGFLLWANKSGPTSPEQRKQAIATLEEFRRKMGGAEVCKSWCNEEPRSLWLVGNAYQPTDQDMQLVVQIPQLSGLGVESTELTNQGLKPLQALSELTDLWIKCPHVSDAGLIDLRGLANLTRLNLSTTEATDQSLSQFKCLPRLVELDLSHTPLTDAGLQNLAAARSLTILRLVDTDVSTAGLNSLRDCKQLSTLDLTGTLITDDSLSALVELRNLKELIFNDTNLTDAAVDTLMKFNQLQALSVGQTRISPSKRAELQKALPNTLVIANGRWPSRTNAVEPDSNQR